MAKRPFIRKQKRKRHGVSFWDAEYASGGLPAARGTAQAGHLKLSDDAGDDLKKFTRWLERQTKREILNPTSSVFDAGCGNGRNLIWLAENFGMHGVGYDISSAAIKLARLASAEHNLTYEVRSIAGDLNLPQESQNLVLDMMSSHFLNTKERAFLREQIFAALKPGGWLFMKTFLRDGDLHSERLLKEFPTKEDGSYTHPVMGMAEHVYYEDELVDFLEAGGFTIHKIYRSHKHILKGKARKRRTVSLYAQKPLF